MGADDTQRPADRYCECGQELAEGVRFCPSCGREAPYGPDERPGLEFRGSHVEGGILGGCTLLTLLGIFVVGALILLIIVLVLAAMGGAFE